MRTERRTNVVWGLVFLGAAVLIFLQALQVLPAGAFDLVKRAWPALLVLAGLSIILRPRVSFGAFLALLISAALVVGAAATAFSTRATQKRDSYRQPIQQTVGGAVTLLRLQLSALSTDVELLRAVGAEPVISGLFTGSQESTFSVDYQEDGPAATLALRETQTNAVPLLENVGRAELRLELPPDLPIDVEVVGSSGSIRLNMSGLALERLNLDLRDGSAIVTLPAYQPLGTPRGDSLGTLAVRRGDITLSIPLEVAARLDLNRGASGIDPLYDPEIYNFLVGDVLEARSITTAEIAVRYSIVAPGGRIRVQVPSAGA